ncbi:hypothetical protein PPTG_23259 [Phytophthora nicotianae INRA-310]|uniref:Uncharacterized protein n=1 Tax=Phytophthora nicotianae (strain INRA-310) TaxID=761204 RepID=W2Q3A4_PHYN3|nr:hypothetical protein PPTG_23259 [Phytophthora nicotianae INRA-310]ETN06755.1 hypothetical protein PPTG_23259 [Phytophthora nicotianae INRA-310]
MSSNMSFSYARSRYLSSDSVSQRPQRQLRPLTLNPSINRTLVLWIPMSGVIGDDGGIGSTRIRIRLSPIRPTLNLAFPNLRQRYTATSGEQPLQQFRRKRRF